MSNVLIPLGGAGGKNRGTTAVLGDGTPFINSGSEMNLPLPAGNYKKSKSNPRTSYGDGKNAEVTISVGLLRKMVLKVFGIASISNFGITPLDHRKLRITWARPNGGLWNGVRLVFKQGSLPTSIEDGFLLKDSADVYLDTEAMPDGMLFVRAFNYLTVSNGRWYDDGEISASIKVEEESGNITLSAGAGTWTVPDGVRKIRYILVGHGGAGAVAGHGGGGGGGGYFKTGYMEVTPGQGLSWIVPSSQGQPTTLNGISAGSGNSPERMLAPYRIKPYQYRDDPQYYSYSRGGTGGSGGGGGYGWEYTSGSFVYGGRGGTNGSMGFGTVMYAYTAFPDLQLAKGGDGQGTSTRGFNGVLYSGGGGGMASVNIYTASNGYPRKADYSYPQVQEPIYDGEYYRYLHTGLGGDGGGGHAKNASIGPGKVIPDATNGTDGLGGGGGGSTTVKNATAGRGGTGCIYIAWGKMMND